ncbi:MAG: hemerythrin domain-containing protein [Nanoarchaeota archaeon]
MNITKTLKDEHKNILKVAELIEKECNMIKSGKNIDKDFFNKSVYFIRYYADKLHHAKEEDILFGELCKEDANKKMHCNPVDQMLYEHNLGRDFVKNLEEAVNKNDKKSAVENALAYVQLIREHIYKEDNILYPMAEDAINEDIKNKMLKKYNEAEKQKKDVKENCLDILKKFEKRKND